MIVSKTLRGRRKFVKQLDDDVDMVTLRIRGFPSSSCSLVVVDVVVVAVVVAAVVVVDVDFVSEGLNRAIVLVVVTSMKAFASPRQFLALHVYFPSKSMLASYKNAKI